MSSSYTTTDYYTTGQSQTQPYSSGDQSGYAYDQYATETGSGGGGYDYSQYASTDTGSGNYDYSSQQYDQTQTPSNDYNASSTSYNQAQGSYYTTGGAYDYSYSSSGQGGDSTAYSGQYDLSKQYSSGYDGASNNQYSSSSYGYGDNKSGNEYKSYGSTEPAGDYSGYSGSNTGYNDQSSGYGYSSSKGYQNPTTAEYGSPSKADGGNSGNKYLSSTDQKAPYKQGYSTSQSSTYYKPGDGGAEGEYRELTSYSGGDKSYSENRGGFNSSGQTYSSTGGSYRGKDQIPSGSSYNSSSYNRNGRGGSYGSTDHRSYGDSSSTTQGGSYGNKDRGRGSYSGSNRGGSYSTSNRGGSYSTSNHGGSIQGGAHSGSNRGGYSSGSNRGGYSRGSNRGGGSMGDSSNRGGSFGDNSNRGSFSGRGSSYSNRGQDSSRGTQDSSYVKSQTFYRHTNQRGRGGYNTSGGRNDSNKGSYSGTAYEGSRNTSINTGTGSFRGGIGNEGSKQWDHPLQQNFSKPVPTKPDNKNFSSGSSTKSAPFVTKPQSTTTTAASVKSTGKAPVFGSGSHEPFARGTRGLAGNPPAVSTSGKTDSTKATTTSAAKMEMSEKPKSAIEKQAEIAQKCAASFKGATTPIDISKADEKKSAADKEAVKPIVLNPVKPDGTKMTPEEIAHEEEIQRKIKESVVTVTNDSTPSMNEVDRMIASPPSDVPENLRGDFKKMLTPKCCSLCSLPLINLLQAAQHYQGKNHAKRVRQWVNSGGKLAPVPPKPGQEGMLGALGDVLRENLKGDKFEDNEKDIDDESRYVDEKRKWEYCTLCGALFTSLLQAEQHYKGKNHAKKLRITKANFTLEKAVAANIVKKKQVPVISGNQDLSDHDVLLFQREGTTVYECTMCNVMVNTEEQLTIHLRGIKHKNKMKMLKGNSDGGGRGRGRGRGDLRGEGHGGGDMLPRYQSQFRGGLGGRGGFSSVRQGGLMGGGGMGGRQEPAFGQGRGRAGRGGRGGGGGMRGGRQFESHNDEFKVPAFPEPHGFKRRLPTFERPYEERPYDEFGPPIGKRPRRGGY